MFYHKLITNFKQTKMKNSNETKKDYKKGDKVMFWKSSVGNFSKQWTGIITKITVLNAGTRSELKYADIKYFNDYGDAYNYKMKPFESLISVN